LAPKYNTYVLGGNPELDVTAYDTDNHPFIPNEVRLSVKDPTGLITTISGGINNPPSDLIQASGYMYYLYRPPVIGWYEYESWVKDGSGRETTATNGFEIVDRLY